MEPVLWILVSGALVAFVTLAVRQGARDRKRVIDAWMTAGQSLGLSPTLDGEYLQTPQGMLDGVHVLAQLKQEQQGKTTVFRSMLNGTTTSIPRSLEVRRDSLLRSMGRLVDGRDVALGDHAFDELVELPTLDAQACAALSYESRRQLAELIGCGGEVSQGVVVCATLWTWTADRSDLMQQLRLVSKLARSLSVPSLHERLAHNARRDPIAVVRMQNLRFLAAPETQTPPELLASTARALLEDRHAPVRLLAAQQLGAEANGTLRALVANPSLELGLRIRAVERLALGSAPDLEGLRDALAVGRPHELVCATLSLLGGLVGLDELSGGSLLQAVVSCTYNEHERARAAAARTLGEWALPELEPPLLELLTDSSPDVQRAGAEALGACGSIAAVEPLLPLAQSLLRPELRQAARAAIGRIQSRLGNVEAGRISLSDPHDLAGAVDLADTSAQIRSGELPVAEGEEVTDGDAAPTKAFGPAGLA